ncbi:hypothetical protein BDZ89DRAFT_1129260 [Hymenopellis radicata]|nr:hypothetical protein BDZ89DRAFT_1129260 [Hymenopellis radicata]
MSWIWTVGDIDPEDDAYLVQCVQIEWSKALARKIRWAEEVEDVKEEMWCILRSLTKEEGDWRARATREYAGLTPEEQGGRKVYATGQAKAHTRIREKFIALWLAEEPAQGQKARAMDKEAQRTVVRLLEHLDRVPGGEDEEGLDGTVLIDG